MTKFGKIDHFGTSGMHFIAPHHRYTRAVSKHSSVGINRKMLRHSVQTKVIFIGQCSYLFGQ